VLGSIEFGSLLLALLERCKIWGFVVRVGVVGLVSGRGRDGGEQIGGLRWVWRRQCESHTGHKAL
jgi:hypothetical protein